MAQDQEFYKDYESDAESGEEPAESKSSSKSLLDADMEYPLESRCCITGDEVKHSYCRYPDAVQGSMMVMSHDSMLKYSRPGQSLSAEFERVLELRRKQEKGTKR